MSKRILEGDLLSHSNRATIENVAKWEDEAKELLNILQDATIRDAVKHLEVHPPSAGVVAMLWFIAQEVANKKRAKHAADAGHGQEGGSRSKQEKMRQLWATGKYKSRAQCAKEECTKIGMSYDTARKALINTPDPT